MGGGGGEGMGGGVCVGGGGAGRGGEWGRGEGRVWEELELSVCGGKWCSRVWSTSLLCDPFSHTHTHKTEGSLSRLGRYEQQGNKRSEGHNDHCVLTLESRQPYFN